MTSAIQYLIENSEAVQMSGCVLKANEGCGHCVPLPNRGGP